RNIRTDANSAAMDRVFRIGSDIQDRGRTVVSAVFTDNGSYEEFQDLDVLRRAGILSISAISVSHRDGPTFDLKEASSGEQTMLASFVGLAATLDSGSLILIDEPETSLHPQWQSEFVAQLVARFSRFSGCEYLIATHSPLIISDLPPGTAITSLDHWTTVAGVQLAGGSSDAILATLFRAPGHRNLFVRDELAKAFRILAHTRSAEPGEFAEIQQRLGALIATTPLNDPAIPVIEELLTLRAD
ncbi:MAG: AAA family ATPase, partial [Phenylobacterium sp.]|uniref:AAA family ATPase n=1 Tax=Phenylobacterium sp. TaxID=1871053 RepID=UPI00272F1685